MNPTNSYSFCQSLGIDTANIRIIPQFLRQDYYSNTALRGALDDIRPNKSFLGFHPHGRLAKTEDLWHPVTSFYLSDDWRHWIYAGAL